MRLATLPPRVQVLLTIAIPLVSLLIAFLLVWPYAMHLRQVRQDLEKTQATITEKEQVISQAEAAARGRDLALAVALPSEQEPIDFLKELARLTNMSGATLAAVRATGTTAASSRPAAAQDNDNAYGTKPAAQAPPPPSGATPGQRPVVPQAAVREVQNQVTVEGPFSNVLALVVRLENDSRLLSISRFTLRTGGSHSYPRLQAVFTLSRFVATSTPVAAGAAKTATSPAAKPPAATSTPRAVAE